MKRTVIATIHDDRQAAFGWRCQRRRLRYLALQLRIHGASVDSRAFIAVGSVRHLLGIDAGAQEGCLPRLDIILRFAAQIQLFIILQQRDE